MNHKINSQSRARLLVVLTTLLVVALSAVTWQPATATVLSDNQQPAAPANQITTTTYEFEHSFLPAVRRTLTTSITDTEFGDDSVCIAVQVLAKNLKGFDIRAAVFFFYANGTAMESGDSSGEFATQSGYLTSQSVYTSGYTNSKWAGTFCVPYVFFPSVSVRTRGFIQAQSGVDGQEFVSFSGRAYFTISP